MEEYSEKQLAILKVAERLFATQCFHGTSVRDIAHAADMNIAMVSYYFGSKKKLLEAIFKYRTEASRKFLSELLESNQEPLEKIYALIDRFANKLIGEQYFHCIMSREQMNCQQTIVQELIWKMREEMLGLMRPIVTRGQEAGTFYGDVDVEMMLITIFGTIQQTIATQFLLRKSPPCDAMSEDEFKEYLRDRVSRHLKKLFKAILIHEF